MTQALIIMNVSSSQQPIQSQAAMNSSAITISRLIETTTTATTTTAVAATIQTTTTIAPTLAQSSILTTLVAGCPFADDNNTNNSNDNSNKGSSGRDYDEQLYVNLSTFWYCFLAFITILGLLVALVSNMIIIYLFTKTPYLRRNPSNIIAVNLSLSDLLYCTQWPSVIYCSLTQTTWILEIDFVCQTFGFLTVSTALASILTVLAMSIERAIVITNSIHAKRRFTIRGAWLVVVLIWIVSICSCLPPLFGKFNRYTLDPSKTSCTLDYLSSKTNYKLYILVLYIGYWIAPAIIITICYILIIDTFKQSSKNLRLVGDSALLHDEGAGCESVAANKSRHHQQLDSNQTKSAANTTASLRSPNSRARFAPRRQLHDSIRLIRFGDKFKRRKKVVANSAVGQLENDKREHEQVPPPPPPPSELSSKQSGAIQDGQAVAAIATVAGVAGKDNWPVSVDQSSKLTDNNANSSGPPKCTSSDTCDAASPVRHTDWPYAPPAAHRRQSDELQLGLARGIQGQNPKAMALSSRTSNWAGSTLAAGRQSDPAARPEFCEQHGDGGGKRRHFSIGAMRSRTFNELRIAAIAASHRLTQAGGRQSDAGAAFRQPKVTGEADGEQVTSSTAGQSPIATITATTTTATSCHIGVSSSQHSRNGIQFRLAKMSFYLILLWLVSWTPIASLAMINSMVKCHHRASALAVFTACTMTKLGPTFDVFIYGISHPKIKSKFKQIIKWLLVIGRTTKSSGSGGSGGSGGSRSANNKRSFERSKRTSYRSMATTGQM